MEMDSNSLMAALRQQFPELLDEFDDECMKGLLHLEVAVLSRVAQDAISNHDKARVQQCFNFADEAFRGGDADVRNAVAVSFLEHLSFADTKKRERSWAFPLLSRALQREFKSLMQYLGQIHKTDSYSKQLPST